MAWRRRMMRFEFPFIMLLVAPMAGIACGVWGWRRLSARARAAWERAVPDPETACLGVHRAASRGPRLVRMPLAVPVLGFTSHALSAGHAAIFLFAGMVRHDGLLAAAALALAGLGVLVSRGARALVTPRSADAAVDRRRMEICAVLSFLVHATIVTGLVALWRGRFDGTLVDVFLRRDWFGGQWVTMSLGELRGYEGWLEPIIGGMRFHAWIAFCLGLLVHACGALAEAVLALWVSRLHYVEYTADAASA